jgi:shikimate kinase
MYGDEVCTSLERNVVLIGFMGSGKSVVGRELTRLMRRRLVDTDQEVVRRHRMGISAIFAKHGEERFRQWEQEAACELAMSRNLIIATGGGLPANGNALDELKVFGFTVYLSWPFEVLFERIRKSGRHRPLVQHYGKDGLAMLFAERIPRYRAAELEICATGYSPKEIARVIRHAFKS